MDFPNKNRKRAMRRHHRQRIYKKSKVIAKRTFAILEHWIDPWAKRNMNNRKKCSCWMCCNPRRIKGKSNETLQEVKHKYNQDEY
jgi:hypothetical protein